MDQFILPNLSQRYIGLFRALRPLAQSPSQFYIFLPFHDIPCPSDADPYTVPFDENLVKCNCPYECNLCAIRRNCRVVFYTHGSYFPFSFFHFLFFAMIFLSPSRRSLTLEKEKKFSYSPIVTSGEFFPKNILPKYSPSPITTSMSSHPSIHFYLNM